MTKTLTFLPLILEVDEEAEVGMISQRFGDHKDDVVAIEVTKDQAIQVAEFLLKAFKVKKSETVSGDPAGFDRFWDAYPNKKGKHTALAIWKRDNCATIADDIIRSIRDYSDTREWRDGYIPHPTTFLRQKRYQDDSREIIATSNGVTHDPLLNAL